MKATNASVKTIFLDQGVFLGGAERFLLDFFAALSPVEKRQLQPLVVGALHPHYQAKLEKHQIPFEVKTFHALSPKALLFPFPILKDIWYLFRLAKRYPRAVIFTNTPRMHLLMLLTCSIFPLSNPWIAYFHDFTLRPSFFVKAIGKKATFLIANAIPTRQYLRARIAKAHYTKIRIIENGIPDAHLQDPPPPPKALARILILGRIDPRKGQYEALAALAPISRLQVTIVGSPVESDPETLAYEKKIQKAFGSISHFKFLPEVEDPFSVIKSHDLVVFPSIEPETFGRVVIEALALNRLVLASSITGPREILRHFQRFLAQKGEHLPTEDFFLFNPHQPEMLREKIQYLQKHPELLTQWARYGNAFVASHYPLRETKKRLLEVLRSAAER